MLTAALGCAPWGIVQTHTGRHRRALTRTWGFLDRALAKAGVSRGRQGVKPPPYFCLNNCNGLGEVRSLLSGFPRW